MIIETKEQLDIKNIGVPTENIEANINVASMPFLFEMLSGSLYSNSIGSICREITSNCFDSHIEANVDDPVVIKKGCDEEGYYISFIDVGIGLSPERIENIYMNYFSSTKRETNSQIGGFGLGSKSPLSYTDYFYIITIFNNIKHQYIFSKGKYVPVLDLINTSETTNHNGTEIRIYIKDNNDVEKFRIELTKQLCYFDNVYFENWDIENDYTIFEGTYFKYRNKNQYDKNMHIILDKVVYPIDWKQLNTPIINIAVGIKFEIGELQVTPNREQLRYTDEIIVLVNDRIKKAIDELVAIFDRQNTQFESFFEWLNKKNTDPHINFTKDGQLYKLYLYGLKDVTKKNTYKYFEGIEDIANVSDILSLFYIDLGEVNNRKKKKESYSYDITHRLRNSLYNNYYISNKPYTNIEKDWLIGNGYIYYPKLNLKCHDTIFKSVSKSSANNYNFNPYYFNLGAGLRIYKLMKAIREEVALRCKVYRELTEQELLDYKEYKKKNNSSLQKRLNGKVFVNSISENRSYDWSLQTDKLDRHWAKGINNYTGIVIYGFKENKIQLEKALTFIRNIRSNYFKIDKGGSNAIGNNKIFKIIKISKQNEKYFKKRSNMININNLYGDNALFRDMASSFKIEKFFNNIQNDNNQQPIDYIASIKLICKDIGEVLEQLYNFYIKNNGGDYRLVYERNSIEAEVIKIAEEYNLYNSNVELLFDKVKDWFKDVEIIRYININDKTLPYILKLLYEKKKRMNVEYYQRVLNTDNTKQLKIDFNKVETEVVTKFTALTQNVII